MQTQAHPSLTTNRLRHERERRELSVSDLARLANVPTEMIVSIEGSRYTPSLHLAVRLSRALGTPVERLFGPSVNAVPETPIPPVRVFEAHERARTATARVAYVIFLSVIAALVAVTPFEPSLAPAKVVVYAMIAALIVVSVVVAQRHALLSPAAHARWVAFCGGFFVFAATSAGGDLGGNRIVSLLVAATMAGLTVAILVRERYIPTPLLPAWQARLDAFIADVTTRVTARTHSATLPVSGRDILHNLGTEVARWVQRVRQGRRTTAAGGA